jgi:membrane protein DedA with SNARE-associated domain
MAYVIGGIVLALLIGSIVLYFAGRRSGKDSVLKGVATAEAEKRREDDKIDTLPLDASKASDIARKLAKRK